MENNIRKGWRFICSKCPFSDDCEHTGTSHNIDYPCEVIDFNQIYFTIKLPYDKGVVVHKQKRIEEDEDLIPTEKNICTSLLDKSRECTKDKQK
jgi:hypothetical protein